MRTEILQGALTKEQRETGFELVELDDHLLESHRNGTAIAHFSAQGATIAEIRKVVHEELNKPVQLEIPASVYQDSCTDPRD